MWCDYQYSECWSCQTCEKVKWEKSQWIWEDEGEEQKEENHTRVKFMNSFNILLFIYC